MLYSYYEVFLNVGRLFGNKKKDYILKKKKLKFVVCLLIEVGEDHPSGYSGHDE